MSKPILLVLGAGNNIGLHTASFFAKRGYRVAVVSRSISPQDYPQYLAIKADLADSEAIKGVFDQVRNELGEPNVVLYNGNCLNGQIMPNLWTLGVGKSATAHAISAAAQFYANNGYGFYYVDERKLDGGPAFNVNGEAHAEMFWQLSQLKKQENPLVTFVPGKGRVDFDK
ncbi:hypothetical protein B7463_g827, partial [Scytalidium lignicola]